MHISNEVKSHQLHSVLLLFGQMKDFELFLCDG
jgi:hypothetical protein